MTKGDKSFIKPHNPLPLPTYAPDDYSEGAYCIKLSPQWYAYLFGLLEDLEDRKYWPSATDAQFQQILDWIGELAAMTCDCGIQGVRVNKATGKIETTTDGINWNEAQSTDGSGYTVVFDGDTIINNLYKLPANTHHDKYCTAAWSLAYAWADDCQDLLELIDFAETVTAEAIENFVDSLVGWVPILSAVVGVVEFLHEGLTQPIIDFVRENCTDADAIQFAANLIYCAFRDCLDNNIPIRDWHSQIDYSPLGVVVSLNVINGIPKFENWDDVLAAIAATLQGESAGWAIVAYGGFVTFALDALAVNQTLIEDAIAYAANAGLQRSNSECGECPDCSTFISTDDRWEITLGSLSQNGCDDSDGVQNGGSGELEIWLNLASVRTIQSVFFHSTAAASALKTSKCEIYLDETLVHTVFSVVDAENNPPQTCNNNSFEAINAQGNRVRFYETSVSSTRFDGLEVCWS